MRRDGIRGEESKYIFDEGREYPRPDRRDVRKKRLINYPSIQEGVSSTTYTGNYLY